MMNVDTLGKKLIALGDVVRVAVEAVAADDASPAALREATNDLAAQHREIKNRTKAADPRIARELVRLLEAVADRAKHAAEEADGIDQGTRQAVIDAHDAISGLESEVEAPTTRERGP